MHNHQPVGNFDSVFEDCYNKAYLPFLRLLQKYSSIKTVLHYSGNLLAWMNEKHPEAVDILRELANSGRIEFLSGGFYEPILSVLPEKDRIMQIKELTHYIKDLFGNTPEGLWLAERVWEPDMPKYLSEAGIEYLPLDDYHFKLSGLEDENLTGYYITEYNGCSVKVFPGSEKLRYFIPFRAVEETISYLREVYNEKVASLLTLADDGEKFGVWPETFKHCYENGWLDSFFSALEANSGWIETTTFSDYQSRFAPLGRVYLPTASYREMGEWALPSEKGREYERILEDMQKAYGEQAKALLRGGIWRSFFSKYPESNHMHKRMLMISEKVHEAAEKAEGKRLKPMYPEKNPKLMLHELWQGQCNDAYWHGIFGGLYLPHLRSSIYRHLISAEKQAENMLYNSSKVLIKEGDLDCDGFKDMCMSNEYMTVFFSAQGGSLTELSLKKWSVNVLDALSRRPEAYHAKLAGVSDNCPDTTKTIHERLTVKEEGLSDYLVYDAYKRASLLDRFFDCSISLDSVVKACYEEKGDFINGIYEVSPLPGSRAAGVRLSRKGTAFDSELKVEKTVKLKGDGLYFSYELEGGFSGIFAPEFNISLLGSPYCKINLNNRDLFIKDTGMHEDINSFSITDSFLRLRIMFSFSEEITLWHYPVETVSLSEEGIERIYQCTAFLFANRLDFTGHKRLGFNMHFAEAE